MVPVLQQELNKFKETTIVRLIEHFFKNNDAGVRYLQLLQGQKVSLDIDHITIRCLDVEERAKAFLTIGYIDKNEKVEYPEQGWWAKVYRKEYYPAIFIDQAYSDERGKKSPLELWVKKFGDNLLHHVAVRVKNIDQTKTALEQKGVEFSGDVIGGPGTRLRQIFTAAEIKNGSPFTVLELTERNNYDGFYPDQADGLMKSSTKTRSTRG